MKRLALAMAVAVLALAGCTQTAAPATPTADRASALATSQAEVKADIARIAATNEAKATLSTSTPVPPTSTPKPKTIVDFRGQFDPPVLRVGAKLVIKLGLENKSNREIAGFSVFSTGPWDKYTIVNVMPAGDYSEGIFHSRTFFSGLEIPPGESRWMNVVAYPNEPGNHEFTFIPHEGKNGSVVDDEGQEPIIGGKVSVIR